MKSTLRILGRLLLLGGVVLVVVLGLFYRPDIPLEELRPRYADASSRFLPFGGRDLHYRDQGQGPPLVLLHGTAASLHTWDGWVETLQDQHRIVRLDLPGFGLTGPSETGDHTTVGRLAAIRALAEQLGLERFSLAGSSLGGYLAWNYALTYPEQVSALILIDAAGLPRANAEEASSSIFELGRIPVLRDILTRFTPRFLVARGLRQVYGDPSQITDERIDLYYAMLLREGNRQALVENLNRRGGGLDATGLTTYDRPVLIQWGEVDPWIPVADAYRFQELLPQAELRIYPEIGHVLMEEIPEASAKDVAHFLATALPSEASQETGG